MKRPQILLSTVPLLFAVMPAPTRGDVAFGRYLLVPRSYHLGLASVLTLLGLLIVLPSWFFFKKSITFMVGFVVVPLGVAFGMWVQAVLRSQKKMWDPTTGTTWLFIDIGTDRILGVAAAAGAVLIAIQSGILSAGLGNCASATWSAQSLAELIYGTDFNCTAVTDWTSTYRSPDFATKILTYQMCLDDYALTIGYVVVGFMLMVVMVLVGLEQLFSRDQTLQIYRRLHLYYERLAQDNGDEDVEIMDDDDKRRPLRTGVPLRARGHDLPRSVRRAIIEAASDTPVEHLRPF